MIDDDLENFDDSEDDLDLTVKDEFSYQKN